MTEKMNVKTTEHHNAGIGDQDEHIDDSILAISENEMMSNVEIWWNFMKANVEICWNFINRKPHTPPPATGGIPPYFVE